MHANLFSFCEIMTKLMSHDSVCWRGRGIANIGFKFQKEGEEGKAEINKNKVYNFLKEAQVSLDTNPHKF